MAGQGKGSSSGALVLDESLLYLQGDGAMEKDAGARTEGLTTEPRGEGCACKTTPPVSGALWGHTTVTTQTPEIYHETHTEHGWAGPDRRCVMHPE